MAIGAVDIYQVVSRTSGNIVANGFINKVLAKKSRNDFILSEDPEFFNRKIFFNREKDDRGDAPFYVSKGEDHWKKREDGNLLLNTLDMIEGRGKKYAQG